MELKELLQAVDHTLLTQTATWEQIKSLCDDGIRYGTASVCIPPAYVREAKAYVGAKLAVCTVIGFPNGYNTAAMKAAETADAVRNGADEIDMVVNLGWVKDARWDELLAEMKGVRAACVGKVMKVIIETCLLTQEEKIKLCELVTASGADYIKTSTGFSTGGATLEDVALMAKHIGKPVRIKAAGGISSLEDGKAFLELGASRLGTSRIVKLVKAGQKL